MHHYPDGLSGLSQGDVSYMVNMCARGDFKTTWYRAVTDFIPNPKIDAVHEFVFHVHVIPFIINQLAWGLWPDVRVLYLVNIILTMGVLAWSSWHTRSPWLALSVLFFSNVTGLMFSTPCLTGSTVFLAIGLYALTNPMPKWTVLACAIGLCLCVEDMACVGFMLGLVSLSNKDSKYGVSTMVFCSFYFILAVLVIQPYFSQGLGRSSHLVYCFQNLNWMKRHAPHFLYIPLLAFLPAFYFVPKIHWAKGLLYVFVIPAHYWLMSFARNTFPAPYMLMVWACMYNWFLEEL